MAASKRQRWTWLGGTTLLLVIGIVVGLVLQNVWLGILLAAIVSIGWLLLVESRKGDNNTGVGDETHGIEV